MLHLTNRKRYKKGATPDVAAEPTPNSGSAVQADPDVSNNSSASASDGDGSSASGSGSDSSGDSWVAKGLSEVVSTDLWSLFLILPRQ